MKVNGTQEIGARMSPQAAVRADAQQSPAEPSKVDRVESSQIARQAMAALAMTHEAHVENIASQVKQGTYVWPTSQQIADRILDDAVLAARLQAMLAA